MRAFIGTTIVIAAFVVGCAPTAPEAAPNAQTPQPVLRRLGFAGAGTSNADLLLRGATLKCLYGPDSVVPAAALEFVLEVFDEGQAIHARVTFNPDFVDNTYGANAVGWDRHTFKDLVGSDHSELTFLDAQAQLTADAKLDYISEDASASSGFLQLGVVGGEGKMLNDTDPATVLKTSTSLDRNLNERGYGSFVEDSPATDDVYTPNAAAPDWDYRVVYEAYIDAAAFAGGVGDVQMSFVHASPSKASSNTLSVGEDECPADWDEPCDGELCNPPSSGGDPGCTGEICGDVGGGGAGDGDATGGGGGGTSSGGGSCEVGCG